MPIYCTYRLIELSVLLQECHTLGSNFSMKALAMQHLDVVKGKRQQTYNKYILHGYYNFQSLLNYFNNVRLPAFISIHTLKMNFSISLFSISSSLTMLPAVLHIGYLTNPSRATAHEEPHTINIAI